MSSTPSEPDGGRRPHDEAERVAVLERALWARFDDAADLQGFVQTWLALQVRQLGGAPEAVVLLRADEDDGFAPVASWPQKRPLSSDLVAASEAALEQARPSVKERSLAIPLSVDGALVGVAAATLPPSLRDLSQAQRTLRWGTGWLISALRRRVMQSDAADRAKMAAVFDLLGAVIDAGPFGSATVAAANLMARATECEQVAIAFRKGREVKLVAMSDVAEFKFNTAGTEGIERAVAEAVDQEGSILYPPPDGGERTVSLGHKELARMTGCGELLTVPLFAGGGVVGALHFQKRAGEAFGEADVLTAEAAAAALGPLLHEKARADRSGVAVLADDMSRSLRKLTEEGQNRSRFALAAVASIVLFCLFATGDFRVTSQAEVRGAVIRSITAPYDGYVFEEFARAGDTVEAGSPLAKLDDRDLAMEHLRWETDLDRYRAEYERALAMSDAPNARIAAANIAQTEAKLELVSRQLERSVLEAPFDASVIQGDLSRSLGAAVRRGEELFQLAPLDEYRVSIEVEETHLDEIAVGQEGILVLASLPEMTFPLEVTLITSVMRAEEGRNFAIVEARVGGDVSQLRPGMRGVAKVSVERRRLVSIWTQPLTDWLRLTFWRWTP